MGQDIRELVIRMYYEEKMLNAKKIAEILGINPRTAQRYVAQDNRYEEFKRMRRKKSLEKQKKTIRSIMRQKRSREQWEKEVLEFDIIEDFFKNKTIFDNWERYTETKISEKYNMSIKKIIRILRKSNKYQQLESWRKLSNDAELEFMHNQDVKLMSKGTKVSNSDLLRCIKSAYNLSDDKNKYVYNDAVGAKPNDIPRIICSKAPLLHNEKQRIEVEKYSSKVEESVVNR